MTNEMNRRNQQSMTQRLTSIWQDVKNGQRRFDSVNRPWLSDVRRNRSL